MKTITTGLLILIGITNSAFAGDYTGKLQCFASVMSDKEPGFLEPVEMSGSSNDDIKETFLGSTVLIDLADASSAKVTNVSKTLTNNKVFKGEVSFGLSFGYTGSIAAGNLSSLNIELQHNSKNGKMLARSTGRYSIPSENDGVIKLELFSPGTDLLLVEVECGIARN